MTKRNEFIESYDFLRKLDHYETDVLLKTEIQLFMDGTIDEETMKSLVIRSKPAADKAREERMAALANLLKQKPMDLSNLKKISEYVKLRVEEGVLGDRKLLDQMGEIERESAKLRLQKLDFDRGNVHNTALCNFVGMHRDMNSLGINPMYSVEGLDPAHFDVEHLDPNLRNEITNWMLQLASDIENTRILELKEKNKDLEKEVDKIGKMSRELHRHTVSYGGSVKRNEGSVIEY